ncbi:MAG: glucose-1-phosphate thymidylyltransferase [Mucilaginibacter polytrichastri]|nr:glucose-1-phosphate thymidylyltransferase [Mucilaginibacter polytrichastri]
MVINLFDDNAWSSLRPLTFTRPVGSLRLGILTIAEKWAKRWNTEAGFFTQNYLARKFGVKKAPEMLMINGSVLPDEPLADAVSALRPGEALFAADVLIALIISESDLSDFHPSQTSAYRPLQFSGEISRIVFPEQLFSMNAAELEKDFNLHTSGRSSAGISSTNTLIGDRFFAEEGAVAECATFNTLNGPVYLGRDAQVWEGANIRGGFSLGEKSGVKMGAKIYGATTIGPNCRVGGEIKNVVMYGNSNKGHEGYLGDSIVGEWCNFGADTNNSNMKNNYSSVRIWSYETSTYRDTGMQFCGLIMADHAKSGINTMFNTGTVVGVSANVFGGGYPPKFVPDFAWGGSEGFCGYLPDRMIETAQRVFTRQNAVLGQTEQSILHHIFEQTQHFRNF